MPPATLANLDPQALGFAAAVFAAVAALAWLALATLLNGPSADARLRARLSVNPLADRAGDAPWRSPRDDDHEGPRPGIPPTPRPARRLADLLLAGLAGPLAAPFVPADPRRQADLRRNLGFAGLYAPSAPRAFQGAKVLLTALGLAAGAALGACAAGHPLALATLGALAGYVAPALWLRLRRADHHRALDRGLPEALDLLVICVESGLALDAALQRVAQELALAHPRLARELDLTHMETRIGVPRTDALRNLGRRTGLASLQLLAGMLAQAERFGTGIAQSLRVHAETLREKRQCLAEEAAAKASVKLSFPVVLFIFPAVLIVLAGPAIIGLLKSSLFTD